MDPVQAAIVDAGPTHLRVRGHDVLELMRTGTFTDMIFCCTTSVRRRPGNGGCRKSEV